jgi:hypothetical protein
MAPMEFNSEPKLAPPAAVERPTLTHMTERLLCAGSRPFRAPPSRSRARSRAARMMQRQGPDHEPSAQRQPNIALAIPPEHRPAKARRPSMARRDLVPRSCPTDETWRHHTARPSPAQRRSPSRTACLRPRSGTPHSPHHRGRYSQAWTAARRRRRSPARSRFRCACARSRSRPAPAERGAARSMNESQSRTPRLCADGHQGRGAR